MNNKRGWIRVVEAFVAVMIVTGAILIIINRGYIGGDISEQVYELEYSTLKEISADISMRDAILSVSSPVEMSEVNFPSIISTKIKEKTPNYLECNSKICDLEDLCALNSYPKDKNVYAQAISITATLQNYSPRQLKIFCWTK